MSDETNNQAIAYYALSSGRRPTSADEVTHANGYKSAAFRARKLTRDLGCKISGIYFDHSTYKHSDFFLKEGFAQAVEAARQENAPLLVNDLFGMLIKIRDHGFDRIDRIIYLRKLGITLYDTTYKVCFNELHDKEILRFCEQSHSRRLFHAAVTRRTDNISQGHNNRHLSNSRRYSAAWRRRDAEKFAKRIAETIDEIRTEYGPEKLMTLLQIAGQLNHRSITTRRGKKWRPESVRRILDLASQDQLQS